MRLGAVVLLAGVLASCTSGGPASVQGSSPTKTPIAEAPHAATFPGIGTTEADWGIGHQAAVPATVLLPNFKDGRIVFYSLQFQDLTTYERALEIGKAELPADAVISWEDRTITCRRYGFTSERLGAAMGTANPRGSVLLALEQSASLDGGVRVIDLIALKSTQQPGSAPTC